MLTCLFLERNRIEGWRTIIGQTGTSVRVCRMLLARMVPLCGLLVSRYLFTLLKR